RDPGKLRIGFYETPSLSHVSLHPDVATAVARTASALEELGHELVEVAPPFDDSILPMFTTVWNTLATLTPVAPDKEELLRPLTKHLRQLGWQISGPQLAGSISMLRISARAAMIATNGFDAILAPTIADIPALVGQLRNDDDPAADFDAQVRYSPFCAAYNVTGQPAINVPMNWNANGLPIGVQLVGRMFEEETIISLAAQLEAAHSWLGRYPAIW
ncbi:MAG: amidase family protein, partial [Candidatus Nanopelagicales bacterium]